jgi:ParB-like chromosome segregation protein Spo0J
MSRKNKKEILSKEIQKDIMAKRKQITLNRDEIVANPLNDFGIEDIPELKNSIMLQGLLDPLGVMGPLEDNRYMLLSGERRWRAINELVDEGKMDEFPIPVFVIDNKNLDVVTQKLIIKTSNLETRQRIDQNRHRAEIMELLKMQVDSGDITRKEMALRAAKFFKTSDRYGRYWRMVFESDDSELKDMVKEDKIDIKSASYIAGIEDEGKKSELKEKIKKGEDSRTVVKDDISKKKAEKKPEGNFKAIGESESVVPENSSFNSEDSTYPLDIKKATENAGMSQDYGNLPEKEEGESSLDDNSSPELSDDFFESRSVKNGRFRLTPDEMKNLSADDLDPSFFEPDEDVDLNLDGIEVHESERISTLMNEDPEKDEERYLAKLNSIIQWCKKMKNVEMPTEAEWDVISACKEVVDKFM